MLVLLILTFCLCLSAQPQNNEDVFFTTRHLLPKSLQSASPRCQDKLDQWCQSEARFHCKQSPYANATFKNNRWGCIHLHHGGFCPAHGPLAQTLNYCQSNLTVVDVFVSGDDDINTFRIPAIVQTNNGSLLAFAEGRVVSSNDCKRKIIVVKRSIDSGKSWQKLQKLPFGLDDLHMVVGNPQPVFDATKNATLIAFGTNEDNVGCNPGKDNWVMTSENDGQSWGKLKSINNVLVPYAGLAPGPGGATQMTKVHPGRLVFAGHYGSYKIDVVWFSDNGGETYTQSSTPLESMDEAQVVELSNGSLLLNMRTQHLNKSCNCRAISRSNDGGQTWGKIEFDPTLISPVCQASLVRINDDQFYFSNPASMSSRVDLTIRKSVDDCKTWPSKMLISPGPLSGGYSNIVPAALHADNSMGGILFERPHSIEGKVHNVVSFTQFPLDF